MQITVKKILEKVFNIAILGVISFVVFSILYNYFAGFSSDNYAFANGVALFFSSIFFLVAVYFELRTRKFSSYEKVRDFFVGLFMVPAIWLIFSLGSAYIIQLPSLSVYQMPYEIVSGAAGIIGILLAFYVALRSKKKSFLTGAVIGAIYPLFLSGSCMLGGLK